jgi:copper resistance protein D
MDAFVKASLYIGTILLVGAGVYRYFVSSVNVNGVESPLVRLRWLLLTGFVLVVLGSVANLILTVVNVLGRFDAAFIWQYTTNTRHGTMTFVRLGLALLIFLLILNVRFVRVQAVLVGLASLGFFYTFSSLSHPATMGRLPLAADFLHIAAATTWAGAVIYSAFLPVWSTAHFGAMIRRVSGIGLSSVFVLVFTGVYIFLTHRQLTTTALLSSTYEQILLVKVCIVLIVLALSAVNRWYFVPRLEHTLQGFRRTLLTESVLLLFVLVTTGLLTVTPPPHQ